MFMIRRHPTGQNPKSCDTVTEIRTRLGRWALDTVDAMTFESRDEANVHLISVMHPEPDFQVRVVAEDDIPPWC